MLHLLCVLSTQGQKNIDKVPLPNGSVTSNQVPQFYSEPVEADSFINQYSSIYNIDSLVEFSDTSLDNHFNHYVNSTRRDIPYINLGNLGSASFNPMFAFSRQTGFNLGFHQYDIYNQPLEDFRFYDCNRSFADLMFSYLPGEKNNFIVKADYTQQFSGGMSFSINYDRILQKGFYLDQATKTTNFTFSTRYKSENGKLTSFLTFKDMVNQEGHNGGVSDESFYFIQGYQIRERIPVTLASATTRHDRKMFVLTTHISPVGNGTDTTNALTFVHDLQYEFSYYKYSDIDVSADSVFYKNLLVDSRGIRYYTNVKRLSNAFYMKGRLSKFNGAFSFSHDLFFVDEENKSFTRNDLTLGFKGGLTVGKWANIELDSKLGIGENIGVFNIDGNLNIPVGNALAVNLGMNVFRSEVPYIFNSLRLNNTEVYSYDFNSPFGSSINASLDVPLLNIRLAFRQSLVTNLLYWQDSATPAQNSGLYSNTLFSLHQQLRFWKIGMTNDGFYQVNSSEILPLSPWFTKHGLYMEFILFKKALQLRLGGELSLFPAYDLPAFSPVIGQFYRSDIQQKLFPATDIYITAKVQKFRIFFKLENFSNNFIQQINNQVAYYPQFDPKLRVGIRWQLLD